MYHSPDSAVNMLVLDESGEVYQATEIDVGTSVTPQQVARSVDYGIVFTYSSRY